MYCKTTHMKLGEGAPHLTGKQKWLKKNFRFLNTHIVHQFQGHPMLDPQKSQIDHKSESLVQWSRFQLAVDVD